MGSTMILPGPAVPPVLTSYKLLEIERSAKIAATMRFMAAFGDMTLWNTLAPCVVLPYISPYLCMTTLMLWGHGRSVAPQTA